VERVCRLAAIGNDRLRWAYPPRPIVKIFETSRRDVISFCLPALKRRATIRRPSDMQLWERMWAAPEPDGGELDQLRVAPFLNRYLPSEP